MEASGKLVLGTVQFGCQYGINSAGRPSPEMVGDILDEAKRGGIAILDTSSAYGDAEQVLGACHPADFKIVSKYPKGSAPVGEMISSSISRLGVRSLYGYLLHHFELYRMNPSIWQEFRKVRDEGKCARIGFSLYSPEELELILSDNVVFDLIQVPRNIFDRRFDPYFKELKDRGVEIHVRSTFLQGLFFKDRDSLPEKLRPMRPYLLELDRISADRGIPVEKLALGFNLSNPNVDGVLIGVDNPGQLRDNLALARCEGVEIDINVAERELLNPSNCK